MRITNRGVRTSLILCAFCFLVSCSGYQIGQGNALSGRYSTITVPYVVGDQDGYLTAAIVKEIVRSGLFEYQQAGGSLILYVKVIDLLEDNIGFRYDRRKRGTLTQDVIPTETRITIIVELKVVEAISCNSLLGPVRLSASVDYDHDYYSSRDGVNVFSLGQLSDLDAAYDAAQIPLNRAIAEKIADYLIQAW